MVHWWGRAITRILNIKIKVRGTAPEPPFLLVSNHLSYIDIPLLFTQLKCVFIAKKEVSGWPLMGYSARVANTIFVDRQNHRDLTRVNKLIAEHITNHHGVVLFPEGTSSKGDGILPFRPSLLQFPASENMPVYYATVSYLTGNEKFPAYLHVCWWGDMGFFPHLLGLVKVPSIEATITFGAAPIHLNDRKELAKKLWGEANKIFTPVVSLEE